MIAIMIDDQMKPGGPKPPKPGGVAVPLDSLSVDGQPPEIGDEVEISGMARVASVDDGQAMLEITEINGSPAGPPKGDEPPDVRSEMMRADGMTEEDFG